MKQDLNENIDEYLYKIMKCKREWPASDHARFERDFPQIFRSDLKTEIGTHIIIFKHTNFDELFRKPKELKISLRHETSPHL